MDCAKVPDYRTLTRSVVPTILNFFSATSVVRNIAVDSTKAGSLANSVPDTTGRVTSVRMIPPSQFGTLDAMCSAQGPFLFGKSKTCVDVRCVTEHEGDFDNAPITLHRRVFFGETRSIPCTDELGNAHDATVGDRISVKLGGIHDFVRGIPTAFQRYTSSSQFIGEISSIIDVRHGKGWVQNAIETSNANDLLKRKLSFINYDSNEQHFVNFTPFIKPSDTLVILRPCPGRENCESRLIIVFRFWVEHGEDDIHALYVPNVHSFGNMDEPLRSTDVSYHLSSFCNSTGQKLCSIRHITFNYAGGHNALLRTPETVCSVGHLQDGAPYLVHRFLLYWDGFGISSRTEASVSGIYLTNLNLPPRLRVGVNSVRVINLAPPGASENSILPELLPDLEKGMTA